MKLATQGGIPLCPPAIADAVEHYARQHGRSASVHFAPIILAGRQVIRGTWFARFSLKPNDPRMKLYREGRAAEPPTEDIWFHVPNPVAGKVIQSPYGHFREPEFLALDITQMGVSGIRRFLEQGNTWSGRGEFGSLEEQLKATRESRQTAMEKLRATAKEDNRHDQRAKRRWRFKIPFLDVQIDLGGRITKTKESGNDDADAHENQAIARGADPAPGREDAGDDAGGPAVVRGEHPAESVHSAAG